ncbi:4-oxalocrotonate tautomerase [Streptococcus canis]|uniref:4-oxalocrotonate tautomerase n=1 Tax=Streptococcus canis TaxID=1329 RepID=UPI0012F3DF3C|nr:4-oxalocrotonate tautomerase [Streptococcus canis]GFE44850.1 putative tautomerase [Streptococcus canis]
MPFITIDLFEGRSQEQKNQLAREVTEVVSRIAQAPKESIHVFINDMPEGTYFPQGELKRRLL